MNRSQRLLKLIDILRRYHQAVTAQELAAQLGVSPRTIYRDIATLCEQGADIRGEAGLGFILYRDLLLPPLAFNETELETLVLSMRWAMFHTDGHLAENAKSILSKINAILPERLLAQFQTQRLFPIGQIIYDPQEQETLHIIREALRQNKLLHFDYTDVNGKDSQRVVQPLAMGYFPESRLLVAWCQLRQDFRHFRPDRMHHVVIGEACKQSTMALLAQWQEYQHFDLQRFFWWE